VRGRTPRLTVPCQLSLGLTFPFGVPIRALGGAGRVAPRSGLAVKHFLDVGAGVIDADYRGAVGVVMFNFSDVDYKGTLCIPCIVHAIHQAADAVCQFVSFISLDRFLSECQ